VGALTKNGAKAYKISVDFVPLNYTTSHFDREYLRYKYESKYPTSETWAEAVASSWFIDF